MKHVVYQINCPEDGRMYFGITTADRVEERYAEHRRGSPTGNKELTRLLQKGRDSGPHVVSWHSTEEEARQMEQQYINAAGPKALNKT